MLKNFKLLVLLFVIQLNVSASYSDTDECGIVYESRSSSANSQVANTEATSSPQLIVMNFSNGILKIEKKSIAGDSHYNDVHFTFEENSKKFRINKLVADKNLEAIGNIWLKAITSKQATELPPQITPGTEYHIFYGIFTMKITAAQTVCFYFKKLGMSCTNQFPAVNFSEATIRNIAQSWIDREALQIQLFTQVVND